MAALEGPSMNATDEELMAFKKEGMRRQIIGEQILGGEDLSDKERTRLIEKYFGLAKGTYASMSIKKQNKLKSIIEEETTIQGRGGESEEEPEHGFGEDNENARKFNEELRQKGDPQTKAEYDARIAQLIRQFEIDEELFASGAPSEADTARLVDEYYGYPEGTYKKMSKAEQKVAKGYISDVGEYLPGELDRLEAKKRLLNPKPSLADQLREINRKLRVADDLSTAPPEYIGNVVDRYFLDLLGTYEHETKEDRKGKLAHIKEEAVILEDEKEKILAEIHELVSKRSTRPHTVNEDPDILASIDYRIDEINRALKLGENVKNNEEEEFYPPGIDEAVDEFLFAGEPKLEYIFNKAEKTALIQQVIDEVQLLKEEKERLLVKRKKLLGSKSNQSSPKKQKRADNLSPSKTKVPIRISPGTENNMAEQVTPLAEEDYPTTQATIDARLLLIDEELARADIVADENTTDKDLFIAADKSLAQEAGTFEGLGDKGRRRQLRAIFKNAAALREERETLAALKPKKQRARIGSTGTKAPTKAARAAQAEETEEEAEAEEPRKTRTKRAASRSESPAATRGRIEKKTKPAERATSKPRKVEGNTLSDLLDKHGFDGERFFGFVKPGEGFEDRKGETKKERSIRRAAMVRADIIEYYKKPYTKVNPVTGVAKTKFNAAILINEIFLKELVEAGENLSRGLGRYGKDAGFSAIRGTKKKSSQMRVIREADLDYVNEIIHQRIKIMPYLFKAKGTRPSAVPLTEDELATLATDPERQAKYYFGKSTSKRVILTPEAKDWILNDKFLTLRGEPEVDGHRDLKEYLAEKTGKAYPATFTGRGMLTRNSLDNMIRLALKGRKVEVEKQSDKPVKAAYKYTGQMTKDFGETKSTYDLNLEGKKWTKLHNTDDNLTVLKVLEKRYENNGSEYPFDADTLLFQHYLTGMSQLLNLTQTDAESAKLGDPKFMGPYSPKIHDAFRKEMEYLKTFTDAVSASHSLVEAANKKIADKAKRDEKKKEKARKKAKDKKRAKK